MQLPTWDKKTGEEGEAGRGVCMCEQVCVYSASVLVCTRRHVCVCAGGLPAAAEAEQMQYHHSIYDVLLLDIEKYMSDVLKIKNIQEKSVSCNISL